MKDYYDPNDVIRAAAMMVSVADEFKGNNNFEYDLVDIVRQAIAEKGRLTEKVVEAAFAAGDKKLYKDASDRFLRLILLQDELLATRPEFKVGTWIARARSLGGTPEEKELYEWNARGGRRRRLARLCPSRMEWYPERFLLYALENLVRLSDSAFGWQKNGGYRLLCNRGTLDESNKCLFERTGRRLYFDSKTYICGNIRQIT